jgi:hypothetical protein
MAMTAVIGALAAIITVSVLGSIELPITGEWVEPAIVGAVAAIAATHFGSGRRR